VCLGEIVKLGAFILNISLVALLANRYLPVSTALYKLPGLLVNLDKYSLPLSNIDFLPILVGVVLEDSFGVV